MFRKHVLRSFKSKTLMLLMLGIIIMLSSFVYSVISHAVDALDEEAIHYFDEYNQEDIAIEFSPYLNEEEMQSALNECGIEAYLMSTVYQEDAECFHQILTNRMHQLSLVDEALTLEARLFIDQQITQGDASHTIRIFKPTERLNLTYLLEGEMPSSPGEIAIIKNYADHHDIQLNDLITVDNEEYTVSGFILLPDYNLPVITHPFLLDNTHQTLAVVDASVFNGLNGVIDYHVAGSLEGKTAEAFINDYQDNLTFVQSLTSTENNIRSGAIYTELQASQAMGIFLSVIIAGIGIIIVSILMSRTIEKFRASIGVLKALGYRNSEIIRPYLIFIIGYSLLLLVIGYGLGLILSQPLAEFFTSFYLLPPAQVSFDLMTFIVSVMVPLGVLVSLSYSVLKRLLSKKAVELLSRDIQPIVSLKWLKIKQLVKRLSFLTRMQWGFILRVKLKAILYIVSMIFAFFIIFLALSMRNVFDDTVIGYYEHLNVESIGYCEETTPCDASQGEKVLELEASHNQTNVTLVGLDTNATLHPLSNQKGENLLPTLSEGFVISQSFKDLTGVDLSDTLTLSLFQETITLEVVGIDDSYPGSYVFMNRSTMGEVLFEDASMFNAVYSQTLLNSNDYRYVLVIDDLIEQVETMNDVAYQMITILTLSSFMMGSVIIYLLTALSVDDHYYAIALLKVKGYTKKEINKIVLRGYRTLGFISFVLAIPLTLGALRVLSLFMARMYEFVMPLTINISHVLLVAFIYGMIYYIGSYLAKKKTANISLQEVLKIYQE